MEQQSKVDYLLEQIDRCNRELKRLETDSEDAKRIVNPPRRFGMDKFEITYKNQIELERDELVEWLGNHLKSYNLGLRANMYPKNTDSGGPKYLAFMDILGFSSIVKENSHNELDYFISALVADIQRGMTSDADGKIHDKLYNTGYFGADLAEVNVNSILLSDTIIFWSRDDSANSFYELIKTVWVFLSSEAYNLNVALRGAVTVGNLSYEDARISHSRLIVDQSMIYGASIVEAYDLEGKQEWMGCLVSQNAIDHFLNQNPTKLMIENIFVKYLIRYPIPFKRTYKKFVGLTPPVLVSRKAKEYYAVKWPRTWESENGIELIKSCFTKHQKLSTLPLHPDIQSKYNNTVKFSEYVIKVSLGR